MTGQSLFKLSSLIPPSGHIRTLIQHWINFEILTVIEKTLKNVRIFRRTLKKRWNFDSHWNFYVDRCWYFNVFLFGVEKTSKKHWKFNVEILTLIQPRINIEISKTVEMCLLGVVCIGFVCWPKNVINVHDVSHRFKASTSLTIQEQKSINWNS